MTESIRTAKQNVSQPLLYLFKNALFNSSSNDGNWGTCCSKSVLGILTGPLPSFVMIMTPFVFESSAVVIIGPYLFVTQLLSYLG